jgi:2-keto-4-pentenoate hydratase/2-oxohepta-3-ene-1,7-dioic acid hydratase in catechol pathway
MPRHDDTDTLDPTLDPALRSWVASANAADADFPVQNLPYGRFRRAQTSEPWRIGVAIGDQVLDLKLASEQCPWTREAAELLAPLAAGDLNAFMALGAAARRALRAALSAALAEGSEQGPFLELCLVPQAQVELALPCHIADYTDFYTSIHHATAVGRLFRPDNPLLPNYKWLPIGYHGRASSIVVSGTPVRRPHGQLKAADAAAPVLAPTRRLDHELELGILVGRGNELGTRKTMAEAEEDWFGLVLLNDWSARDVQPWEYVPLGPFLAKNFASTVSPWVVTQEALAPYRRPVHAARGRPAAAAVSGFGSQPRRRRHRHRARSLAAHRRHARAGPAAAPADAEQLPRRLLDGGAAARAPHRERLQPAARRPAGHRHAVRPRPGRRRQPARAERRRQAADHAARRRDAHLPGRRRRADAARLLPGPRLRAHRPGQLQRRGAAGCLRPRYGWRQSTPSGPSRGAQRRSPTAGLGPSAGAPRSSASVISACDCPSGRRATKNSYA